MKSPPPHAKSSGDAVPRLSQPAAMKTRSYRYGVETLNGHDAWGLFQAAAAGDATRVEALLAKDPRLVNAQHWYQFPLHFAVYGDHAEIVKLLLERGADPGQSLFTYNSWDKLLAAARLRNSTAIERLLVRAMTRRFHYSPEFQPLKEAIIARDSRQISALVRRRPELAKSSDALGNNPLHWAVITRQPALIGQFVKLGTPVDALRADGQTPALLAANGAMDYWYRETRGRSHPSLRNTVAMTGMLLAHGADYTISLAAILGDQERLEELVRADASLAVQLDSARISPLSYAAGEGHLHIVRRLLELGANPNLSEEGAPDGLALFEACQRNNLPVAQSLLEHGANPNAGVDSSGCCLTICEVRHGKQARPLQQLLRQFGARTPSYAMTVAEMEQMLRAGDKSVFDGEFFSNLFAKRNARLFELALESGPAVLKELLDLGGDYPRSPAQVGQLLKRGLDPNRPDWTGRTLLHACAENGDRSVAALLLDAGADPAAREIEFQGTPLAAAVRACCQCRDSEHGTRLMRMIEFLLKRGAPVDLPGCPAWATPLAWADRYGRTDLVKLLRSSRR